jgi:hypothetical protein
MGGITVKILLRVLLPRPTFVVLVLIVVLSSLGAAGSVLVKPGDNIQTMVSDNPSGTVFSLAAGTYVRQSVVPKSGDSFIGEAGAILNGSTTVTGFTSSGGHWVASFNIAPTITPGKCLSQDPACIYPEDLFFDGVLYTRVTSISAVTSKHWYLSYSAGKVYLADNPTGHKVQISTARVAFGGSASNVTIQGVTIEMYGNPAQHGAIEAGSGWTIEQNNICYNHGAGIEAGSGTHIVSNSIYNNGQLGIGASGSNILIQDNQIYSNNTAGYDWSWEGGGAKFVRTTNLVVNGNNVHDNLGSGLMTDIDNSNVTYEYNTTSNNRVAGIHHEISFSAVIRYNTITNDGYTPYGSGPAWGAGIFIEASSNTEVYGNTVTNCMNGIVGWQVPRGSSSSGEPYLIQNFYVHDNNVTQTNGGVSAGIATGGAVSNAIFSGWGNRYVHDTYGLQSLSAGDFEWMSSKNDVAKWKGYGEDATGIFTVK